jgi:hypothetical protein
MNTSMIMIKQKRLCKESSGQERRELSTKLDHIPLRGSMER